MSLVYICNPLLSHFVYLIKAVTKYSDTVIVNADIYAVEISDFLTTAS